VSEYAGESECVGVGVPQKEPLIVGVYVADADTLTVTDGEGNDVVEAAGESESVGVGVPQKEPLGDGV
jgi:hypothetical protein